MSHRNARTTFRGRLLIVHRHQAGWAKARIAEAMGLSRKCVHTWITRFENDGEAGLLDRSSRPHTMTTRNEFHRDFITLGSVEFDFLDLPRLIEAPQDCCFGLHVCPPVGLGSSATRTMTLPRLRPARRSSSACGAC